jgi:Na+/H+ antiporter NhaA
MSEPITRSPVEKWIINPVGHFIGKSTTGGIVLFVSAMLAIFIANSPWSNWYHHIWEHRFGFAINDSIYLDKSLHHWKRLEMETLQLASFKNDLELLEKSISAILLYILRK